MIREGTTTGCIPMRHPTDKYVKGDIYFLNTKKVKGKVLEKSGGCGLVGFRSLAVRTMDGDAIQKTPPHGFRGGVFDKWLGNRQRDYFLERLEALSGLIF